MPSFVRVPDRISAGDFVDAPVPVSGDNGKAYAYNHSTGAMVWTSFEASGVAASTLAAHVAAGDPHTQYALKSAVALGYQAMQSDDGTGNNHAFGRQALYSNIDGTNNVAIGHQSLYSSNTTAEPANGHNNVAVGFQAGYSNYGEHNAIVGFQAHMYGTLAADNVAVGSMAMQRNEVGDFGVAVGFGALQYNEATDLNWKNTAVGFGAGRGVANVTSSVNNTFIGYYAGRANTTGNGNVLLGYQAGDNLTTGSGNIVIGNDIDAPAVDSANTLNIGNGFFGTGLSGTGGTLSSSAKFGIGTSMPAYTLDVRGNFYVRTVTNTGLNQLTIGDATNSKISAIKSVNNVLSFLYDGTNIGLSLASTGATFGTIAATAPLTASGPFSAPVIRLSGPSNTVTTGNYVEQLFTLRSNNDYCSAIRLISTNTSGVGFLNPRIAFYAQDTGTSAYASMIEAATILAGGDFGIGTNAPASKLEVAGTVRADGLRLDVIPTAETPTATHTITISANGTNYKLLCVAA